MNEPSKPSRLDGKLFRRAIKKSFGLGSTYFGTYYVREEFQGVLVWEGDVHTYRLHEPDPLWTPNSRPCYVFRLNGRITTVVHEAPAVVSPATAVQAAIVELHRTATQASNE